MITSGMKLHRMFAVLFLLCCHAEAAVSIVIEPGATEETTVFTVTQTSPSSVLSVSGLSGYASGMSIPTSMFNIPGLGSGHSSDVMGVLPDSLAAITEYYSGQTFLLNPLRVSSNPADASLLGFDHLFTLPTGFPTLRFDVAPAGPVVMDIAYEGLVPGVYTMSDTLFGTVTYTVVPEPSTLMNFGFLIPFFFRRRRSPGGGEVAAAVDRNKNAASRM